MSTLIYNPFFLRVSHNTLFYNWQFFTLLDNVTKVETKDRDIDIKVCL